MNNVQIGSLVASKRGRDKDKKYMVLGFQGDRVLLVDGKTRTISRPKVKNFKHVVLIAETNVGNIDHITDEKIAHSISTLEQNDS